MVTPTGDGLKILVTCKYLPHENWMAFASWYSISKNLPDAKVFMSCEKQYKDKFVPLFAWPSKVGVPFKYLSPERAKVLFEPDYILEPCWMAVREWRADASFVYAKSDSLGTFVNYSDGCGNFVLSDWINKVQPPFPKAKSFRRGDLTPNEIRVLDLWTRLLPTFTTVVG